MAPSTRIDYGGLGAKFELSNLHREEDLVRAEELLRGAGAAGDGPSVLVLSSDGRGAGRGYFLEALAYRLRDDAAAPRVLHLDLGGFEPDRPNALGMYLQHQLGLRRAMPGEDEAAAIGKAVRWPSSEAAAVTLGALLALGPLGASLERLAEATPQAALERLAAELGAEGTLVLHVADFAQLSEPQRRRLVELAERVPRCFLAFSAFGEASERVAPGARHALLRIEIEPLSQEELREEIDGLIGPGVFAAEEIELLWRSTGGSPALAGARIEELMAKGALLEVDGAFRLAGDRTISGHIETRLAELLEAADGDLGKALRSVLFYGALCGGILPPLLLLEMMEVSEELANEVIDLIDDTLVEELGLIDDLEFRHPGFPGLQVYRYAHPGLGATILHKVGAEGASAAANALLEALEHRLPAYTRSAAELHLALSRHLGPAYQKIHLDRLAWWVGPDDAAALEALVRGKIAAGETDFAAVWKVVESQGQRWPSYRRLALLKAAEDSLAAAHRQGGDLQVAEAYAAVLAATGNTAKAAELQGAVLDSRRQQLGPEHPETLNAMETLALTFYSAQEYALARSLQQQVLGTRREVFGHDHPESLAALWNLAVTTDRHGEGELAKSMLDKAATDFDRVLGPRHPISRAVENWLTRQRPD